MNTQEFSQKVKQKYPAYQNIPDDTLVQAVMKKYPQYQAQIQQQPQIQQGQMPPQMPGMQGQSQGQQQPFNGIDQQKLQAAAFKAFPQLMEQYVSRQIMGEDPYKQSEIDLRKAEADFYKKKTDNFGAGGKPLASIWRNSTTGELTDDPKVAKGPGWHEYKSTQGDVLGKLTSATQSKARNAALGSRSEAWERSIDARQINELIKRTGLTGKQQSALQMNNLRAQRANEILSKPNVTWQELALGEIDLAGIMQGGVPTVDEVKSTHFPGWQQQWAQWKTYATGHPTENVPEETRKKVLSLVNGVVKIDNSAINANADFSKRMLGPTVRGGIGQFNPAINKMTQSITSEGQKPSGGLTPSEQEEFKRLQEKFGNQ